MSTVILEPATCIICGSTHSTIILTSTDRTHGAPGVFTFRRCHVCGLVYQSPRPVAASFAAIYPDSYGPYQPTPVTAQTLHPDLQRTCTFIKQLQPAGGQLLDIGCGPGNFLQALQLIQPRWDAIGIEPDAQAAAYARQRGLRVDQARFEDAQFATHSLDAVTLWNVLEHLPQPQVALKTMRSWLKPAGLLYFAVPLCDCWDAAIWRDSWIGWDLPRHFFAFDRQSLQRLMATTGFEIVATACVSGTEYGFTESLRMMVLHRVKRYTLNRLAIATSYSRPFRLLLRPYVWLAELRKRATVLTVAARPISTLS